VARSGVRPSQARGPAKPPRGPAGLDGPASPRPHERPARGGWNRRRLIPCGPSQSAAPPPKPLSLSPHPLAHVSPARLARRRTTALPLATVSPLLFSSLPPFLPFLGAAPFSPARPWRGPASAAPARRTRLTRPWHEARPPSQRDSFSLGTPRCGAAPRPRCPAARSLAPVTCPGARGPPASVRGPDPLPAQPPAARRGTPAPARGARRARARLGLPCPCPVRPCHVRPSAALSSARRAYGAWPRVRPPTLPRCTAYALLGPGVCVARPRRVSVALRAHVLTWCARCIGAARRAFGLTLSALSWATCSSTPRRAHLPLATRLPLPMYSMCFGHLVYINEMETQLRN
jgi:hypothetical protein